MFRRGLCPVQPPLRRRLLAAATEDTVAEGASYIYAHEESPLLFVPPKQCISWLPAGAPHTLRSRKACRVMRFSHRRHAAAGIASTTESGCPFSQLYLQARSDVFHGIATAGRVKSLPGVGQNPIVAAQPCGCCWAYLRKWIYLRLHVHSNNLQHGECACEHRGVAVPSPAVTRMQQLCTSSVASPIAHSTLAPLAQL